MDENQLREVIDEQHSKNNLDRYLRDLYSGKLKFRIGKEERRFIKTGVETLTRHMGVLLLSNGGKLISKIKSEYKYAYPGLSFHNHTENFVRVGSMYDKTKNGSPDEFDFILVLFTFYCECDSKFAYLKYGYIYEQTFKELHYLLRKLLSYDNVADDLKYVDNNANRLVIFNSYTCNRGASSRLKMFYINQSTKQDIYVDVVLAVRRLDPLLHTRCISTRRDFDAEIATTGSVLYVNEQITFTETETRFIRETLSAKHRKTYRILKYLINGLQDGWILEEHIRREGISQELITSQMIKTEIIFHHYLCSRIERAVSPCVLAVLERLKYYDSNVPIRSLTHSQHVPHFYRSVEKYKALDEMTSKMHAMKKSKESYAYDEDLLIPLASTLAMPTRSTKQLIWDEQDMKGFAYCVGSYVIKGSMLGFAVFMFVMFVWVWIWSNA